MLSVFELWRRIMRRGSSWLICVLIFATSLFGQSTPRESLLVLSKHDHTLAVVDPATLKVVAKMPVGDDPHEVIATADGKTAYVSNYGGGGAGALHTLAVIDLVNQKALAPIDLGALRGPYGPDFYDEHSIRDGEHLGESEAEFAIRSTAGCGRAATRSVSARLESKSGFCWRGKRR